MRTALSLIRDSSEILKILVDTGQTVRAGRVIGAFRNIGRKDIADEIAATMKRIGYDVREEDPFEQVIKVTVATSPYTTRLRLMWQQMRMEVLTDFTREKSNLSSSEYMERMEAWSAAVHGHPTERMPTCETPSRHGAIGRPSSR